MCMVFVPFGAEQHMPQLWTISNECLRKSETSAHREPRLNKFTHDYNFDRNEGNDDELHGMSRGLNQGTQQLE